MAGTMKARTIRVSKSRPTAMVVPIWAMLSTLLVSRASMVRPKTIPAVVTTPPVPPNARMMPVLRPAGASSLTAQREQQVVVGADGDQGDEGDRCHGPVQVVMHEVLPDQDAGAQRGGVGGDDGADDDQSSDWAAQHHGHDEEDQAPTPRSTRSVVSAVTTMLQVGGDGSDAGQVDFGRCQGAFFGGFADGGPDLVGAGGALGAPFGAVAVDQQVGGVSVGRDQLAQNRLVAGVGECALR